MFKAPKLSTTEEYVKLLLYGTPGVGKTTFAAQAPNPIFFDFERSTDVLRHTKGLEDTAVVHPKRMSEVFDAIPDLPKSGFKTVVFDTISSWQDFQLEEHMIEVEKKSGGRQSRHLPLFQDFRISTQIFKEIFRMLQNMPINVILIAHDKELTRKREDGTETTVGIRPELTPRLNESVTRLINIAAYYTQEANLKGEYTRKLYVNSTNLIRAKNRLGIQEQFLTNPTWEMLTKGVNSNAS